MMDLLADHNLPFAAALALMLLLAVVQMIGLGDVLEPDLDGLDGDGPLDGLISFMGVGRVPFTVWLAGYLLAFAAIGVAGQDFARSLLGAPLSIGVASLLAGVAALPVISLIARPLGAILPQDETTAVSVESLVGRRGQIVTGRAAKGNPARARVADHFGHPHYVMVEPHEADAEFTEGTEILLTRKEGDIFFGVALENDRLRVV